jgi:hypothetical protein
MGKKVFSAALRPVDAAAADKVLTSVCGLELLLYAALCY